MRVTHIMDLMSRFEFKRGETAQKLAEQWGLSLEYVYQLTAEASRRVSAAVMDADTVRAKIGTALERVLDVSIRDDGLAGEKPKFAEERTIIANRKVIVDAATAWSRIAGADAPKRTEITGADGGPVQTTTRVVDGLSEEQINEVIRLKALELANESKQLPETTAEPDVVETPDK